MIKLQYITNNPEVARIVEHAGVDRVFVDMEYIGKAERQRHMNTVQSHHTIRDIERVRAAITKSRLLVRVNPIHEATAEYTSSEEEINAAIAAGADILMLPFYKTLDEVKCFLNLVDGRVKTDLLLETPDAADILDETLELDGIDEIHIGLNDLSLGYKKKFMFELLSDGTVERLTNKIKNTSVSYGFGGIARTGIGMGMLPAENILMEHVRLGSTCAILSRSFCNTGIITDPDEIREIFENGVREIRETEQNIADLKDKEAKFEENRRLVVRKVEEICRKMNK